MRHGRGYGIFCVTLAAFLYGIAPIFGKITYLEGSNTVTLSFFRSFLSLPFLFALMKAKRLSFKLTWKELKIFVVLAILGCCLTALLLYGAYNYISVGLTTTIHYVYPVLVTITCVLLFKDKISRIKVLALVLSMAGILLFFDEKLSVNAIGVLVALGSGVVYAAYLIVMDKSRVRKLHPIQISFHCTWIASIFLFLFGTFTSEITYSLTPRGWIYTAIFALLAGVMANSLMPVGVQYVGSTVTSILGLFEPIVCVILGILFLNEPITLRSVAGCALVIISVVMLSLEKEKKSEEPAVQGLAEDSGSPGELEILAEPVSQENTESSIV